MLCHHASPVQHVRPAPTSNIYKHAKVTLCIAAKPTGRSVVALSPQQQHPWVAQPWVARAAKEGLEAELDATQKTLDKVLQAVQAAQAAQQQSGVAAGLPHDSVLISREQQLWDRQAALLDRMQQQWDQERQAFFAREQQLLSELSQLRQELNQLLITQASAATAATAAAAGLRPAAVGEDVRQTSAGSVVGPSSSPAAAAAGPAGPPAASSAASRPGSSMLPGQAAASISGPSPASAAVAAAIRAVRDEGLTDTDTARGNAAASSSADGSWQDLFGSSGDRAVSSVASAIAAVDTSDVLADLDLSFGSSSSSKRGRRRVPDVSSNGSSSSNGASSSSNGASVAAPAAASSAGSSTDSDSSTSSAVGSVEVQKGDPAGPPPILAVGDDDIFWVSKLHDGLISAGFYPADDEIENWMFAESTQTALLTFQACNGLPETGVTCGDTWRQLLGADAYEAAYGHLSRQGSSSSSGSSSGSSGESSTAAAGVDVETVEAANGEVTYSFAGSDDSSAAAAASSSSSSSVMRSGGWPVVMDMDGGKDVHALQVCLSKAGYNCGDDDMRWWQFGSTTLDALKTFQACSGLPESGVCDERTWLALLGPDATPDDLDQVRGDESMYEDDMGAPHEGAVWLVGEQRWSQPT